MRHLARILCAWTLLFPIASFAKRAEMVCVDLYQKKMMKGQSPAVTLADSDMREIHDRLQSATFVRSPEPIPTLVNYFHYKGGKSLIENPAASEQIHRAWRDFDNYYTQYNHTSHPQSILRGLYATQEATVVTAPEHGSTTDFSIQLYSNPPANELVIKHATVTSPSCEPISITYTKNGKSLKLKPEDCKLLSGLTQPLSVVAERKFPKGEAGYLYASPTSKTPIAFWPGKGNAEFASTACADYAQFASYRQRITGNLKAGDNKSSSESLTEP